MKREPLFLEYRGEIGIGWPTWVCECIDLSRPIVSPFADDPADLVSFKRDVDGTI